MPDHEIGGVVSTATAPLKPVSSLPPCGDIASAPIPPDCVLQSRDQARAAFEIRHRGSGPQASVAVTVLTPDGTVEQTFTEASSGNSADPRLRDLDGDGRDELLVPGRPVGTGCNYVVYHAAGDALRFQRAGELAGIALDTAADGYIAVTAREDYANWRVEFWAFDGDTLQPLVVAAIELLGEDHATGSQCTVTDSGGLDRLGLSIEDATARFCAEPSVARLMR